MSSCPLQTPSSSSFLDIGSERTFQKRCLHLFSCSCWGVTPPLWVRYFLCPWGIAMTVWWGGQEHRGEDGAWAGPSPPPRWKCLGEEGRARDGGILGLASRVNFALCSLLLELGAWGSGLCLGGSCGICWPPGTGAGDGRPAAAAAATAKEGPESDPESSMGQPGGGHGLVAGGGLPTPSLFHPHRGLARGLSGAGQPPSWPLVSLLECTLLIAEPKHGQALITTLPVCAKQKEGLTLFAESLQSNSRGTGLSFWGLRSEGRPRL